MRLATGTDNDTLGGKGCVLGKLKGLEGKDSQAYDTKGRGGGGSLQRWSILSPQRLKESREKE